MRGDVVFRGVGFDRDVEVVATPTAIVISCLDEEDGRTDQVTVVTVAAAYAIAHVLEMWAEGRRLLAEE